MFKHSTNIHKEKERLPLIDCFDFSPKSVENLKKMTIELNKFIIGGPLFSNHHPVSNHHMTYKQETQRIDKIVSID